MIAHAVLAPIPMDENPSPPQRVQLQRHYARRALQHCAKICGAPLDGWRQDQRDAPLPNEGFFWSISHKRQWAGAVIAKAPVGIDIESLTPRRANLFDAVATDAEWALLPDQSWHSFFLVFTAKEAVLKANGVGIGYLAHCRVAEVLDDRHMIAQYDGRRYNVEHYEYAGHIAAVSSADRCQVLWHVHGPDGTP